ncbi:MAG TPA: glycosyltransferase [Dehalococcoidia bacterium]|nr:glycosyltransferase [Dehalococcoidia bacterium]
MSELPGPPLRIAVLGDFDGPHTRAWVQTFVERGHDVHAISYYAPRTELDGLTLHVLNEARRTMVGDQHAGRLPSSGRGQGLKKLVPPNLLRVINATRYRRAGLRRLLEEIRPDVFHAHYAVEHGFYGAFAGYHPYVISAWGSDLLVESQKAPGRRIASWALSKADLVTGNDGSLIRRAVELGVAPEKAAVVHLGIEKAFLDAGAFSVNLREDNASPLAIISDRAIEPLYNIDTLLEAFADVRRGSPELRLIVAGTGSQVELRMAHAFAKLDLARSIDFAGHLDEEILAQRLAQSHIYVSVPSSDSLALSNLEAMAAGAFPIVSDLPSVDGWVMDGINGLRVPAGDARALAAAIRRVLGDPELRRTAAETNRTLVEARGLREPNMLLMERHYYRLAGHPIEDQAI